MRKGPLFSAIVASGFLLASFSTPAIAQTAGGQVLSQDTISDLNGRLAALERMVASVVSGQERDHRALTAVQDATARARADTEARMAELEQKLASLEGKQPAAPAAAVLAPPPRALTPDERFIEALGFAEKEEWTKAEFAFDTFIANNPSHPRLAEARYWLGRSLAGEGKPAQAAKIFLALYDKDPAAPLALDSLFALAEALVALGPKSASQACDVYAQIDSDFSSSLSAERRQKLADQRIALNCKS